MKKLFVILALAGMVGSVSATTLSLVSKTSIVALKDDGKKKKSRKEKKCEEKKACCTTEEKGKCAEKKGGCCKDKQKASEKAPATPK